MNSIILDTDLLGNNFNLLEGKKQKNIIHTLNLFNENCLTLNKIDNLLSFLERKSMNQANSISNYILIYQGVDIKKSKIIIPSTMTNTLFDQNLLVSDDFREQISNFQNIYIEILYPSLYFNEIYQTVLNLKNSYKIKIAIYISDIGSISTCFQHNSDISFIRINSDVTQIENNAFEGCRSLEQIIIPSSITSIEDRVFKNCPILEQITIPNSVTKIGAAAFCSCKSLKKIIIPSSVKLLKDNVFNECISLEQIDIPSSITKFSPWTFCDCTSLKKLTLPSSIIEIEGKVFDNCSSLTEISIPSSVQKIAYSAFDNCTSLEKISVPSHINTDKFKLSKKVIINKF